MSRRALGSAGSLRLGSPASRLLRRAPTSRCPTAASLALAVRGSVLRRSKTGPPKFLDDPSARVPRFFDPGEASGAGPPGLAVPTSRSLGAAFHVLCRVGLRDGHISRPNSAAHVLAVYASSPGLPSVATQDSLPAGGPAFGRTGFEPARSLHKVSAFRWAYIASSLSRLSLAHRESCRCSRRPRARLAGAARSWRTPAHRGARRCSFEDR
jgi:hypothetical protein